MSDREHHGEKELASFIRAGAERRPDQAYGDYFRGKSASCALGAAYEGMYRLPRQMDGAHPTKDLEWFFDCLEGTVRRCPMEGCKKKLVLSDYRAPQRRAPLDARADCDMARIDQWESERRGPARDPVIGASTTFQISCPCTRRRTDPFQRGPLHTPDPGDRR